LQRLQTVAPVLPAPGDSSLIPILGRHHKTLLLFDGFAGRGRYRDGEEGSPLRFWQRAVEAVDRGRPERVRIRCVELNASNVASLDREIAKLRHPNVTIAATRARFADAAGAAAKKLHELGGKAPPTFWTADPYGFRGVPLDTIRDLMSIPRSEILITFMVRDMRRFLDQLVRDGIARFATPFRVFEDERRQTLYYLVHLTNHALGMRQMKRAMIKESADMTFWPVTVRPPDQLELDTAEQPPFPRLQVHLAENYTGHGRRAWFAL